MDTFNKPRSELNACSNKIGLDLAAESLSQQRKAGISLARRRYQKGSLIKRGTREKVWVGRWLEDVILADGTIDSSTQV